MDYGEEAEEEKEEKKRKYDEEKKREEERQMLFAEQRGAYAIRACIRQKQGALREKKGEEEKENQKKQGALGEREGERKEEKNGEKAGDTELMDMLEF